MTAAYSWGAWSPLDAETDPYVHWWQTAEGSSTYAQTHFPVTPVDAMQFARARKSRERRRTFPEETVEVYRDGSVVPVPQGSRNPDWSAVKNWAPRELVQALAEGDALDDITQDTVLVGVIDTGIALSHRRMQLAGGGSRFLASWQQTARFDGQSYLPFGRELYRSDIEAALSASSVGGRTDEDAFNRALGLVEPDRLPGKGNRDLEHRAAHGAHVADLAAGFDPASQATEADKVRLIGVNLPPPFCHGPHGEFLQYFALMAVERIVSIAEALWVKLFRQTEGRFPLVVNFSYGMHAGPKDGSMPFERAVSDLMQDYADKGGRLRICMPSGNKNLERNTARFTPGTSTAQALNWRVSPGDQTSNILELWTQPIANPGASDFEIELTAPGKSPALLATLPIDGNGKLTSGLADMVNAKGDVIGRAYVRPHVSDGLTRVQLILCVAPTSMTDALTGVGLAPAGAWRLALRRTGGAEQWVDAHIQVDQSAELHSDKGRRSYFEDALYKRRDKMGREIDSYPYPFAAVPTPQSAIRRRGTHNPLATSPDIIMVAGYDAKSGSPAKYSGAAWDDAMAAGQERDVTIAMPSEDSGVLFGVLASGASDGSSLAYRGTSMATGLATRRIVEAWLAGDHDTNVGTPTWLGAAARAFEASDRPDTWGDAAAVKVGQGRLPYPETYREGAPPRS